MWIKDALVKSLLIWMDWKYCGFPLRRIVSSGGNLGNIEMLRSHPIWPCDSHTADQCLKATVHPPKIPKNVIYTESWHPDRLQGPHMGLGVSSSHQLKIQSLFPVSHLALGGDDFPTITSIHEASALGSTLDSSSLSWSKRGNSCHVFPVMLLIFKYCSLEAGA